MTPEGTADLRVKVVTEGEDERVFVANQYVVDGDPADGQAPVWNEAEGRLEWGEAGGGVTDHGALTGLADDDHAAVYWPLSAEIAASFGLPEDFPHGAVMAYRGATDFTPWIILTTRKQLDDGNPRLIRINPADPLDVTVVEFPGMGSAEAVVYDADYETNYVYVIFASTTRIQVARVDIESLDWTLLVDDATEGSSSTATLGPAITMDSDFLYVATYTDPAKLIKYNLTTGARVSAVTITGKANAHGCQWDSARSQVVVTGTVQSGGAAPGWIARVATAGMTLTENVNLQSGFGPTDDFALAGTFAYVGTESATGRIARVSLTDFTSITYVETGRTDSCWGVFTEITSLSAPVRIWALFSGGGVAWIDPTTLHVATFVAPVGVNEFVQDAFGATQAIFLTTFPATSKLVRPPFMLGGGPPNASAIPFTPAGAVAATKVQTAIEELDLEKIAASLFDANTILKADSDNTPVALSVAEDRILGRITGGSIAALTAAQIKTLLAYTAAGVTFSPTGGIAATNVQSAIAEVDSEAAKLAVGNVFTEAQTINGGTTAKDRLNLGADVNLYRSAANVLKTDDGFRSGSSIISNDGLGTAVTLTSSGGKAAVFIGADVELRREAASVLKVANQLVHGVANAAPTDANIAASEAQPYLDETGSLLKWRIRKSDGTYVTASLAYV